MKFIQGNVISLEYTINDFINNVPRQKHKEQFKYYIHNAHKQNI